jgi:hypothetical protein
MRNYCHILTLREELVWIKLAQHKVCCESSNGYSGSTEEGHLIGGLCEYNVDKKYLHLLIWKWIIKFILKVWSKMVGGSVISNEVSLTYTEYTLLRPVCNAGILLLRFGTLDFQTGCRMKILCIGL